MCVCVEMKLSVHHIDIVESRSDALVCPAGNNLEMTSQVAKEIKRVCSGNIYENLQRYESIDSGDVAVSPGYNLAAYILHAVTSPNQQTRAQNVRTSAARALELADDLGCETISFPVIGTGAAGIPFDAGVKIIGETVDAYQPNNLTEAKLVCKDKEKYQTAQAICDDIDSPWVNRTGV